MTGESKDRTVIECPGCPLIVAGRWAIAAALGWAYGDRAASGAGAPKVPAAMGTSCPQAQVHNHRRQRYKRAMMNDETAPRKAETFGAQGAALEPCVTG